MTEGPETILDEAIELAVDLYPGRETQLRTDGVRRSLEELLSRGPAALVAEGARIGLPPETSIELLCDVFSLGLGAAPLDSALKLKGGGSRGSRWVLARNAVVGLMAAVAAGAALGAADATKDVVREGVEAAVAVAVGESAAAGEAREALNADAFYFDAGSSQVDGFDLRTLTLLTRLGTHLQQHPEDRLRLVGHASSEGNDSQNAQLARDRAAAVAYALISRWPELEARIEVFGNATHFSSPTPDPTDRRVDILLSSQ